MSVRTTFDDAKCGVSLLFPHPCDVTTVFPLAFVFVFVFMINFPLYRYRYLVTFLICVIDIITCRIVINCLDLITCQNIIIMNCVCFFTKGPG